MHTSDLRERVLSYYTYYFLDLMRTRARVPVSVAAMDSLRRSELRQ